MNPQDIIAELEVYFASTGSGTLLANVIWSLVAVVGMLLLQRSVGRLIDRRITDPAERYRWNKLLRTITWGVSGVIVVAIWLKGISGLATMIALVAAGLAIALRDPIVDLGGWLYIGSRHPFKVGDRIAIAGQRGDVVDISPFVISLMQIGDVAGGVRQSTGRVVTVPNKFIFTNPLVNENLVFDYIWREIGVVVTYESDWRRAKQLLEEIVVRHCAHLAPLAQAQVQASRTRYMLSGASFDPTVFTRVVDHGVELTMRFLSEVRGPLDLEMIIWEDVLQAFEAEPAIDLAYTTSRVYNNREEGKPALGGPGGER